MKKRQDRQYRAVHGHRDGHAREIDAVEQCAHVVDGVDRDTGHANITFDARMIAVVAAMGGEIEGDREALLAGGNVAPVERIRLFRRREPGVLADGPRLRHVHCRVRPAQIGRNAWVSLDMAETGRVLAGVNRSHVDALRCRPGRTGRRAVSQLRPGEWDLGEIG